MRGKIRQLFLVGCLTLASWAGVVGLGPQQVHASGSKITLTTAMVTNEGATGDATMLVDEQTTAGDPKNGAGGAPTTAFFPGWGGSYPASAYIDLGQNYDLTDIYLRDASDIANMTVSAGNPGSWTALFTDGLANYNYWSGHAVTVTTRYVRVTMSSGSARVNEIVLYGTPTGGGSDTTAPAAVSNLAAPSSTSTSVSLSWTAPGDDGGTGTAASYDIRYNTSTIDAGNWASSTQASGEPAPAAAGTGQTMTVTGLGANTTYYFAMKTRDEVPNESALSNVVSKATAAVGSGKIALTTAMVTNEGATGDATRLVDEQTAAGDPKAGAGGAPTTTFFPGWGGTYPASAYIDLGQYYDLSDVYLYDYNDNAAMTISAGSPGSWSTLFTDALTNYKYWSEHAVSVTTRYVRVTMSSGSATIAEIVLYGTPSGGPSDTTAPAAVSNLAAPSSTSTSVSLSWTAPGDDGGTGTAASYDIRYNTSTIDAGNWASSTQASGEPAPAAAGTGQTMMVTGLGANTTYYFAMKTRDEVPNESALSNVVSKATAAGFGKIPLSPSMIMEEEYTLPDGRGAVGALVDEQTLAGDPLNGSGGVPVTLWYKGFGYRSFAEHAAILDLGQDYNVANVFIYDSNGVCDFKMATGTPFHWTALFTDTLPNYNSWNRHNVNVDTRYLQIKTTSSCVAREIVLYGTPLGTNVASDPSPTAHATPQMDQFIGTNSFYPVPDSVTSVGGVVRQYSHWGWIESDNAAYAYPNSRNSFNPSNCCSDLYGSALSFDKYFGDMKAAGINGYPVIMGSIGWLGSRGLAAGANSLLPASYAPHGDHMFQIAARYGATTVADNKLKLAPDQTRSTGLNTLNYVEDWNEGDNWWGATRDTYFSPYEAAAMLSADYDGDQGRIGSTIGLKNADPNMKLVMGGLADPNLDYIKGIKRWADEYRGGSFPADVINVHVYANNGTSQTAGTVGVSPEQYQLKDKMKAIADYRNKFLPGKEFWVTEFGYDTHPGSPQRAPSIGTFTQQEVQGQWLVRSYLAFAAAGVDKAIMFDIAGDDPTDAAKFSTSSLVGPFENMVPKTAWYYIYTLKNQLKGLSFEAEQASGNPNVMIYRFKDSAGAIKAYALWSPTSNQTSVNGYQLALQGSPSAATLVTMADGDPDGVASALTIASGKVTVDVNERPIFVLVGAPAADTTPTWPGGSTLTQSNVTSTGVTLNWSAATDDHGVSFYNIYQDGHLKYSVTGDKTTISFAGLTAGTSYTFRVEAQDGTGHISTGGPATTW
ncbi:MAG: fibronectin type III domain-containing protein [Paenibacillaceae bacterium]|nr:fibronectin type III domain-containing protein [Paenibacillaceae bacterium]